MNMKTQIHQIVKRLLKAPAIYQSEHEPFLPGNIARRGVIGTISRKAISPLAHFISSVWISRKILFLSPKILPEIFRQSPDVFSGPACICLPLRWPGYACARSVFLLVTVPELCLKNRLCP